MADLREIKGDRTFPLSGKVTIIGRDSSCDIVVKMATTSGRHAMLVNSGGVYYIEDLGSVNGTYVNDQRISQRTRLEPGDRIKVSGLVVNFQGDVVDDRTAKSQTILSDETMGGTAVSVKSSLDPIRDLRPAVKPEAKLRAVLEISRNLQGTLDLKVVLPKILDSLFAIFPQADCGFILLRDPNTGRLALKARKHRHEPKGDTIPISHSIINHTLMTQRAILSDDAAMDARFDYTESIKQLQIRSIMCVPMMSQAGMCLGVIQLDTRDTRNEFLQEDLDLIVCAGALAARAIELAWMHEEQRELEGATRIQKSFLPSERPNYPGLSFFDYYLPAQQIGGDYYDYVALPGNRLAVALGDVAGKGISAALLMARLSAAARFCLATAPTVPEAIRQLNGVLTRSCSDDRFVTLVVAVLDLDRFLLTLVNAGHMPPLRRRTGQGGLEELGEEIIGLPLAVMDKPYEQMVVPFEPGDTLVLYTDGVSEARNPQGEFYGIPHVKTVIEQAAEGAETIGKALLADVRRFAADRPQGDDMTIVSFGRIVSP